MILSLLTHKLIFGFLLFFFSRDENPDGVEVFYDWLPFILYLHTWSISNDPLPQSLNISFPLQAAKTLQYVSETNL